MILEALHTKISPVLECYPLIGDIEATPPFCLYSADPSPIFTKSGIDDYENRVMVKIVGRKVSEVNTYTSSIRTAIEAITGTVNSTQFSHVLFIDESGVYYNEADDIFMNDLEFEIFTKNR